MLTTTLYPEDSRIYCEATTLASNGYRVSVVCSARAEEPARARSGEVDVYRYRNPLLQSYQSRVKTTGGSVDGIRGRRYGTLGYALGWTASTFAAFATCLRVLARRRIDVVHAHNPPDTLLLVAMPLRLLGVRFVFDHHDLAPEMYVAREKDRSSPAVRRVLLLLERLSYRCADHVIATNESYRSIALQRGRLAAESVTVVRNGPELEGLPNAPRARGKTADIVLGYAGVIGQQDGVDNLVRALHVLVDRMGRTDITCLVIGAGDALSDVRDLVKALKLEKHFELLGWLPYAETLRRLAEADICIEPAPSNSYTSLSTMVKVMDYMALGKPVVGFDLPENRFTTEEAALLADANDVDELARCIVVLADDPERRAAMGAFGRQRIEDELAWCHSEKYLLDAYEQLLARTGKPDLRGYA